MDSLSGNGYLSYIWRVCCGDNCGLVSFYLYPICACQYRSCIDDLAKELAVIKCDRSMCSSCVLVPFSCGCDTGTLHQRQWRLLFSLLLVPRRSVCDAVVVGKGG